MRFLIAFILLGALYAAMGQNRANAAEKWGYKGKNGPEHWGDIAPDYRLCKEGQNQTPIDIRVEFDVHLPPLTVDYAAKATAISNNGHSVQVDFAEGGRLLVGDKEFALLQVHFHAPSENHFNGASYPFEAHFVHKDATGRLAVLAVLYTLGEDNPGIARLWEHMPRKLNRGFPLPDGFAAGALLPAGKDYVYFNGSLTTPPCSEGVRWYVLKEFPTISETQVRAFAALMGHPNNRPLQPVNARVVLD